ncbi:MAG: hypothetical protein HQ502_09975 [Alphaproteobacteria bacterium]|nr:hypothetical protein [Alphaproteobacteria bacterium]
MVDKICQVFGSFRLVNAGGGIRARGIGGLFSRGRGRRQTWHCLAMLVFYRRGMIGAGGLCRFIVFRAGVRLAIRIFCRRFSFSMLFGLTGFGLAVGLPVRLLMLFLGRVMLLGRIRTDFITLIVIGAGLVGTVFIGTIFIAMVVLGCDILLRAIMPGLPSTLYVITVVITAVTTFSGVAILGINACLFGPLALIAQNVGELFVVQIACIGNVYRAVQRDHVIRGKGAEVGDVEIH